MEKFVVTGGKALHGEVTISGAKNAAVGILPATILAADVCVIENLPDISDVAVSLKILSTLGAQVKMLNKNTYEIDTTHLTSTNVPDDLSRQMRASYYFLGALLSRFGKAQVAMPGGCNLGPRPIDQHLKVFSALGAEDSVDYGMITVRAKELNGAHIFFDKVSVGATMNGMLSAVMAKGQTILENCAKEPHVVDLANFLNMCGADVRGAGTDVIKVRGVEKMHGCTYSIIPDQIEAGSYMVAAAATGGDVLIKNVTPKHLEPITAKLRRAGVEVEEFDDSFRVRRTGDILPLKINTMPHPGFPTDMQPLMGVLLSVAKGTSTVTESVWDNRFRYVDELRKMGANVQVDGQVAVFEGVEKLSPAPLRATDLRAGAAMVLRLGDTLEITVPFEADKAATALLVTPADGKRTVRHYFDEKTFADFATDNANGTAVTVKNVSGAKLDAVLAFGVEAKKVLVDGKEAAFTAENGKTAVRTDKGFKTVEIF